ncbi:MAG TPA: hypothetical protein VEA41_10505 [Salinarimonas sp.]|nr:hypothetical protein [Salinarimonas sp.]
MAARLNPSHDIRTRAKIQTSQLINRLSDHVFGKVELTPTQVKSAEILLRKTLPDLSHTEHSGETRQWVIRVPEPAASAETWQQQHAPKTLQ